MNPILFLINDKQERLEKTELLYHKIVSRRKILESTVTHRQEYVTNS
jgi:hypothetical protein